MARWVLVTYYFQSTELTSRSEYHGLYKSSNICNFEDKYSNGEAEGLC